MLNAAKRVSSLLWRLSHHLLLLLSASSSLLMSQSTVMNNFERLFALEPRHFPLPILPFRSDFNGYGVGAKVRLEATPYVSAQSGFEVCLLESGDDIAFFANVSFDSEGRSAIDVKSRFDGKWSPTIRHIAIGIAIDRAFTLEITVNSSEFVVTVDGFKVTEFVKRCDDVKVVLIWGSILVKEITITPSLLYYTPPPQYSSETEKDNFDINALLNKLTLIPTAPEVTPSNTLFNKLPAEEPNELISNKAMVMGETTKGQEKIGLLDPAMTSFAPPRPPPPALKNRAILPPSQTDTCLYSKTKSCTGAADHAPILPFQNNGIDEFGAPNLEQCRRSGYYASDRIVDYNSKRRVGFAVEPPISDHEASARLNGTTQCVSSSAHVPPKLDGGATSNRVQMRSRQARCGSCEDLSSGTHPSMRNRRNDYRRSSRHRRTASSINIYSPIISTQQLQEKTEAVCKAAKNFLKTNFSMRSRNTKQLIRTTLEEPQILTLIATPIFGANKFEVGLMHNGDYVMLFSARYNEKCIVLNSSRGGIWQREERVHRFPFNYEQCFTLKIHAGNPLQMFVNGNFFCEFRLRYALPVDAIKFDNNLRLQQFEIK